MKKYIIFIMGSAIIGVLQSQPKYAVYFTSQYNIDVEKKELKELQLKDGFTSIIDSLIPWIYSCEANQEPYIFNIVISSKDTSAESIDYIIIQKSFFSDAIENGEGYFIRDKVLFVVCGTITDDTFSDDGYYSYYRKKIPDNILTKLFDGTDNHDFFYVYNTVPIMTWHPQCWRFNMVNGGFELFDTSGTCN